MGCCCWKNKIRLLVRISFDTPVGVLGLLHPNKKWWNWYGRLNRYFYFLPGSSSANWIGIFAFDDNVGPQQCTSAPLRTYRSSRASRIYITISSTAIVNHRFYFIEFFFFAKRRKWASPWVGNIAMRDIRVPKLIKMDEWMEVYIRKFLFFISSWNEDSYRLLISFERLSLP